MKKADKIVYLVLFLLLIAVAVLTLINRGDKVLRDALRDNREFLVRVNGEYAATVTMKELIGLGPEEFTTNFATSISAPREAAFRGVELRLLLDLLDIDTDGASHIVVSGLDSYYSPLSAAEARQEGKIYVCFSMDGEALKTQGEGGYGPFLMVIRDTPFAMRWCKYVEAIDVIME